MDAPSRRNVFLLAACQALLLANAGTLIAISALAGYALAADKTFATLPNATYVVGAALGTFPASMWMRRVGRRAGFLTGGCFGLAGASLATFAIAASSFALLCAGTMLLGVYNAFGQYYRFAAADAASGGDKARAISYVLAGGLVGGIVGPQVTRHTRGLFAADFLASYGSLFVYCAIAMAIASFLRVPTASGSAARQSPRRLATIAAQPVFLVAVSASAIGYAVMNLLMTATPLAMGLCGHPYEAAAGVIAAHIVGMFAPSFFTGSLIARFGVLRVMLAGVATLFLCVAIALAGVTITNFWWALVLLGVGWNFVYIGGSTLLTETYRSSERAKAQGLNEMSVFVLQAISAFSSGVLVNRAGWDTLNHIAAALIAIAALAISWLAWRRRGAAA